MNEVSRIRLIALRVVYFLNFVGLGAMVWPAILFPDQPVELMDGVALSFWAALSLLMSIGLRYPLGMLPLLFIQLLYKIIWLAAVALPLWRAGQWSEGASRFALNFVLPVVIDLLVIPWSYVRAHYLTRPAE